MLKTYTYPKFEYRRPEDLDCTTVRRHPVLIVGAGPVGLALAIELRLKKLSVIVIDEDNTVSVGSRGVCYAKRTLEILDRLGVGDRVVEKGVAWNVGRTFFHEDEVYRFDLVTDPDHERPGMLNLQQYYLEEYLVERAQAVGVELRFKQQVLSVDAHEEGATLEVQSPDGRYQISTDWLIAADGARSPIRRALHLDVEGHVFQDRFLIADVLMKAGFPPQRWFWFDPPFHPNQSVLLHRQADDVWRIDFQLGWEADPEVEKQPDRVIPRIRAMLGAEHEFELEWISVYTFQCRRMAQFRHGRVLFVGDSAHQVSPFGARGANSGIQDADNIGWKLDLVLRGAAPQTLLDTYHEERAYAADENLLNSTRSTDFITPKSPISRVFRNAVLELAEHHAFAQRLVNSGRLSVPACYTHSRLNTPDLDAFAGHLTPGTPADDAPLPDGSWLLRQLAGGFTLLYFVDPGRRVDAEIAALTALVDDDISINLVLVAAIGAARSRYDAHHGTLYLLRPDQHVAARWRQMDLTRIRAAVRRACDLH
ncbi:MAG: FAD-dependent oxidoreductase [Pseudomonadota bacterium]|jgi:3-(3-hydroxy-phenyl)propionate hydroxylase